MGVHTGSPTVHGDGYVGMDVHRAARIAGAAHGGQVVVWRRPRRSWSTCCRPVSHLRDLGMHRLKDLDRPEHVFQLAGEGLESAFPTFEITRSCDQPPAASDADGGPRRRTCGIGGRARLAARSGC